jgi:biotin synthase
MTEAEVLEAAQFAWDNRYASIVIQSGERQDQSFIDRIDRLLRQIQELTHNELRVTLSCGEQSESTYRRWFDSGARRYLLRIETSDEELYYQIHPKNDKHDFHARLKALNDLKKLGYQVGSGIMVGLPFQTLEQIANDLIFLRDFDVDMVGMGPYIEHEETPLYSFRETLVPRIDRFDLTLRAIAILRLMMPDINIASATALQAIDPAGREKAFGVGTNVIMPNLTPTHYRGDYTLYEDKPCINENPAMCLGCLEARIKMFGGEIGYGEWGDSRHYARKGEKP